MAGVEDAPAMACIYSQGIADRTATFETEPRSPDDIVRVLTERGDRYPTLVGERGGRVIAVAWASSYRPRACYAGIAEFSVSAGQPGIGGGPPKTSAPYAASRTGAPRAP